MPHISVVIPTYHRNDQLKECLQCLRPGVQKLPVDDFEVIVTDDGARATARAMLEAEFPWARWVAGPGKGPAANRNNGAMLATGKWIAFTDDDCLPSTEWLAGFVAAIEPGVEVYEGRTTCEAGLKTVLDESPINLDGGRLWSCNMMIAADTFERIGGFDARFPSAAMEDVEFFERLRHQGLSAKFVRNAVVDHPPRKRKIYLAAARQWKSRLLFDAITGKRTSGYLPLHILKVRVRQTFSHTFSMDSIRCLASAGMESMIVAANLLKWRRDCENVARSRRSVDLPTPSMDESAA